MKLRKNAIVTGAASGLGRAIALRLASDGWRVAAADMNASGLDETIRLINAAGGEGQAELLDVSNESQWAALRARLGCRWDRIDLLVNNAGIAGAGEVGDFSLRDWEQILNVNLWGPIYGCHTMIGWLKQNPDGGHIIITASIASYISSAMGAAYNVTKAGLVALAETLYAELRPYGIGVTAVCPGFFRSQLIESGRWTCEAARHVSQQYTDSSGFTADEIADLAIRAMAGKKLYVVHGRRARLLWRAKRLWPAMFHRLLAWAYQRWKDKSVQD